MHADNLRRGAFHVVIAAALFAVAGAMIKRVALELPNEMIVFFRSAIGLAALMPLLVHRGASALRTKRLGGHLLRALAGLSAMYCYFYAIAHMSLAEAVLLNYTAPLFLPFVAWMLLEETLSARVLGAIVLGFVGVTLILKPGLEVFTPAALLGLASGILAALAMAGIRGLSRSEPAARTVFYFNLVCTLVSLVPLAWSWKTPPAHLWILLIGIGACANVAQLLLTRGYGLAPAAQIGPFTYVAVIFAALFGWIFWDEVPDLLSGIGAAIVCLAGVLTIRYGGNRSAPMPDLPPTRM